MDILALARLVQAQAQQQQQVQTQTPPAAPGFAAAPPASTPAPAPASTPVANTLAASLAASLAAPLLGPAAAAAGSLPLVGQPAVAAAGALGALLNPLLAAQRPAVDPQTLEAQAAYAKAQAQAAAEKINAQLKASQAALLAAAATAAKINKELAAKGVPIASGDKEAAGSEKEDGTNSSNSGDKAENGEGKSGEGKEGAEGEPKLLEDPGQQFWPWAKRDPHEEPEKLPDEKASEEEYLKLARLTLKGLRKLGYTGPPIMGEKEALGLRFGLHRAGFEARSDVKTIKLLVGLEVDACAAVGFPLLDRLKGPGSTYLIHIMRECPGILVVIHGKGSDIGDDGPLCLKLSGKDERLLKQAQMLADNLIATVKMQFDAYRLRMHPPPVAAAPLPYSAPPLAPAAVPAVPAYSYPPPPYGQAPYVYPPAPVPPVSAPVPPPSPPVSVPVAASEPQAQQQVGEKRPAPDATDADQETGPATKRQKVEAAEAPTPAPADGSASGGGKEEEEYDPLAAINDDD